MRFAIPDHRAPSLAALAVEPAGPARRIPVGVALAVAGLVVLSGGLVTAVAREAPR